MFKEEIVKLLSRQVKLKKEEIDSLLEVPPREEMGDFAYNATIPYFTWNNMVKRFLEELGLSNP